MTKKIFLITIATTVVCLLFIATVVLLINKNNEIKHLNAEIDSKMTEINDLIESTVSKELYEQKEYEQNQQLENNEALEFKVEELENAIESMKKVVDFPNTSNWKYQETSGLRKYIGDTGIRAYPREDSPLSIDIKELHDPQKIIFCRAVLDLDDGSKWGFVMMNHYGDMKFGYVPYNELGEFDIVKSEKLEALGEFQVGDRIEKMIGILDRDYTLASENLCIYTFPDEPYGDMEPQMKVMSGITSIDAFVGEDFHTWLIRTDSPDYPLKSGYKVGDNAMEVIDYYNDKYDEYHPEPFNAWGEFEYKLSKTEIISFRIDSELNEESVITSIWLH